MFPCHEPEEICIVTRSPHRGVVSLGEFHQIIAFYTVARINFTILCIHALKSKSLLRLEQEKIDLFQNPLSRHIIRIMLVGWEARPIARRHKRLSYGELFGISAAICNKVGVSLPGLHAQHGSAHPIRCDQFRLRILLHRRAAHRNLNAPISGYFYCFPARHVHAVGLSFKDTAASPHILPFLPIKLKVSPASQNDKYRFFLPGLKSY